MTKSWCVYEHVFPNGKKYIGITSMLPEKRWNKGWGYCMQQKIYRAVKKYGWENISHNVIVEGLSKEQADVIEQYLIKSQDTIKNGYNITIGGENIKTAYLDPYVLEHVRYFNTHYQGDYETSEQKYLYDNRFDAEKCDLWNEAARAVTIKHGYLSPTDGIENAEFWLHFDCYILLNDLICQGVDMSGWHEPSMPEVVCGYIYGGKRLVDFFAEQFQIAEPSGRSKR